MNPDGVSYLNLSDAWASGDWLAGVSAYWSPLYPAVLGMASAIISPSPAGEAPLLHAVNFLFFVLSLVGFEVFLSELRARRGVPQSTGGSETYTIETAWWDVFMYGLFAWGGLQLIGVGTTAPDMIVAAMLYFAAGLTLKSHRRPSPATFAALGFVLGLGFLAKGALFSIGCVWLALIAAGFGIRARLGQRLLAPAVYLAVALPLIVALSLDQGHVTAGDTGRVNRGWYVNRYPMIWTGLPPGSGKPAHPPLVMNHEPLVFHYPGNVGSSYPFFDDPSYWTEGMTPRMTDLAGMARTIVRQVIYYTRALWPLILSLGILSLLSRPRTVMLRELARVPSLSLATMALIAGYATVVTQTRFFAASAVILALLTFDAFRHAAKPPPRAALIFVTALVSLATQSQKGDHVIHQALMVVREMTGTPVPNEHLAVASALSEAGLRRGDKVGVVGTALQGYWARLGGWRIVAEIPSWERDEYMAADDSTRAAAEAAFWRSGARAIVAGRRRRDPGDFRGWDTIPVAGYFVKWPGVPGQRDTAAVSPEPVVTDSRP